MKGTMLDRRSLRATRPEAVEARVRRALARQSEMLHKVRPDSRDYHGYGPYYIVDERNCVISAQHDLDQLARERNVLRVGEVIAD
jgi:hypothetical protein